MFKEFAKGLSITLKHLLPGNCTTVQYPKQKLEMSPRFRGLHRLIPAADRENVLLAIYVRQSALPNVSRL